MEYDYRNKGGSAYRGGSQASPGYPNYGQGSTPRVGYPQVGQQIHHPPPFGGPNRHPSFHQTSSPSSSSSSSGLGIRVSLKPDYKITPPPQVSPLMSDVPRSNFQFDFEFEKRILAEAEKENPNWGKLLADHPPPPPKPAVAYSSSPSSALNPVVSKYVSAGMNPEAVPLAVANYGDNPAKVTEFANGFALLREMGFSANNVAEALLMYDNDTEKALAHFLGNSS